MTFAIIAAGEGSRLKAEGITVSKPLIPIGGVPMIQRIMDIAVRSGAERFCCIINEDSTDLKEYFRTQKFSISTKIIVQSTPSSMHSLFALAPLLKDEPFCLTTADAIFHEEEFQTYLTFAKSHLEADGILAVTESLDHEKPLYAVLDDKKRILSFGDTKADSSPITGGIYYFSPRIFNLIDGALGKRMNKLRNFLRYLLDCNYRLLGYPFSKIVDVNHVGDIAVAERFLEEHTSVPRR